MFDQPGVRIVAGALLWSTALILLSIAYHGRIFGFQSGVEDVPYMRSLIACTVAGGFFGVFFGGISNIPRHPLWINVGASLAFGLGVAGASVLAKLSLLSFWEGWANGLAAMYAFGIVGSCVGGAATPWLRKKWPRSGPKK